MMKNEKSQNVCPKCGAAVPADAPQGLCPKCVMAIAATNPDANRSATATGEIPSLERVAAAFPHLEVVELIGRGGMGFVFKARQPHLDRLVALKLLPDKLARDPHFAERFNREGRVLAKLSHPNIVSVFDFGRTEHFYFLTMEYVDGVNLRQAMQAGRFSPSEALAIVPKICEALQSAHEQGVLHRDIKPENILLDAKGRVKIADFGIAKLVGEEHPSVTLTGTGAALGTPHYMAPEQLENPANVDERADIYSLGVVFYEMLTGELPLGRFAPPSSKTPVNRAVDDVVFRTLERDREKRYPNADQVKTELEHIAATPLPDNAAGSPHLPPAKPTPAIGPHDTLVVGANAAHDEHLRGRFAYRALAGAVLVGLSLVAPLGLLGAALTGRGGLGFAELWIALASAALPGLGGTLVGWLGLNDIRDSGGRLRGLPLALFATLAWPLLVVLGLAIGLPALPMLSAGEPGLARPLIRLLTILLPAGVLTFAIWAVYSIARWATRQPPATERGALKWIFAVILVVGIGTVMLSGPTGPRRAGGQAPSESHLPLPDDDVELVALSQHPSTGTWWEPDGSPSADGPFDNPGLAFKAGNNERAVEMVFRTHGLPSHASSLRFEIEGDSGWGGASGVKCNGQVFPDSHLIAAAFPLALRQTTIRVGVPLDAWEALAESGSNARSAISLVRDGHPVKVTWLGAHGKGGNTVVIVGCDIQDSDLRVVALTTDGAEHPSLLSNRARGHLEAEFVNLTREQIVSFRLQVRPYRWAEFKNVALEPHRGRATISPVESGLGRNHLADAKVRPDAVAQASERLERAIASLEAARGQFSRQQITELELLTAECRREIAQKLLEEATQAMSNPEPTPEAVAAQKAAAASRLQSALQRLEEVKRDIAKGALAEGDLRLLEAEAAVGVARAEVQGDRLAAARVRKDHARKVRDRVERLREVGKVSAQDVEQATSMEKRCRAFVLALEEFQ